MAGDDLNAPLGYGPQRVAPRRRIPWRRIALGGASLAIVAVAVVAALRDDGMRGEPWAVARIEKAPPRAESTRAPPSPEVADATGTIRPAAGRATANEIEADSGVRVVRPGGAPPPGALIIQVPESLRVQLTPAPDRRLVERGEHGPLPRVGVDGSRPMDVYGRPVVTGADARPNAPRIALVVGGMGLNPQVTQSAANRLPGAVTLGFAPYGPDLDKQVARAREAGHEVILQAPMEPFDAAQAPGPRMLRAGDGPEQTLDNMRWLMSRFTGYVGVSNFLGAKFTSDPKAFAPVLRETGARGLLYLDDGASTRGAARELAASTGANVLVADVNLDGAKPGLIDVELARLEQIARREGVAIGVATGLPATVDHIARFARGLEKRGVTLAPLSSLAAPRAVTAGARP